jgi:biotin carboxyl carrier protein
MAADLKLASPAAETVEFPAARREAPAVQPGPRPGPAVPPAAPAPPAAPVAQAPRFSRQRLLRWSLFALLPLALLAGAVWYVTGGQVVSTDDAYVQANTVGISTDVSGIVQSVDVTDNQHVSAGQVLYRLDPKQFQIALDNTKANLAQVALNIQSMKQDYRRMLSDIAGRTRQHPAPPRCRPRTHRVVALRDDGLDAGCVTDDGCRMGVVQGVGLGFLFTPLSVATLQTLPSDHRAEGAGLFSLSRNIGSSVGISAVNSLLVTNTQVNHADIAQHVTAVNRMFDSPMIAQYWNPATAAGRAALDAVVTRQAEIIAYIDDYKLLMIATLIAIPLLIVFKKPPAAPSREHTLAAE